MTEPNIKITDEGKEYPYSMAYMTLITDGHLSPPAFRTYTFLKGIRSDIYHYSQGLFALMLNISVRSFHDHIKELEKIELITVKRSLGSPNHIHIKAITTVYTEDQLRKFYENVSIINNLRKDKDISDEELKSAAENFFWSHEKSAAENFQGQEKCGRKLPTPEQKVRQKTSDIIERASLIENSLNRETGVSPSSTPIGGPGEAKRGTEPGNPKELIHTEKTIDKIASETTRLDAIKAGLNGTINGHKTEEPKTASRIRQEQLAENGLLSDTLPAKQAHSKANKKAKPVPIVPQGKGFEQYWWEVPADWTRNRLRSMLNKVATALFEDHKIPSYEPTPRELKWFKELAGVDEALFDNMVKVFAKDWTNIASTTLAWKKGIMPSIKVFYDLRNELIAWAAQGHGPTDAKHRVSNFQTNESKETIDKNNDMLYNKIKDLKKEK